MKGWQKALLVGCGCFLLVGLVIGGLVIFGGLKLGDFINSSTAILEYNDELISYRDPIIDQISTLTSAISSGDTVKIRSETDELNSKIEDFRNALDTIEVPEDGDRIKSANEDYLSMLIETADIVDKTVIAFENYNISTANDLIKEFNEQVVLLNKKNVEIAKIVNEVVGYEAISNEEIDAFEETYE